MTTWSRDEAKHFVRALFEHVSHEDNPKDAWIDAWTEQALKLGSAEKTFFTYVNTLQHKKRMEDVRDARPRWPAGHFYSPIVSRREIIKDSSRIFAYQNLPGIDLRTNAQLDLLKSLADFFPTIPFPETETPPFRYRYKNTSYGFGDALIYWSILNILRPRRLVEIGSGFTSALVLDTVERLDLDTVCTFADPYPELAEKVVGSIHSPHRIIKGRVQDLDPALFDELEAGDLLFIDSTHVLKTGSDVHFELTQVLPRLRAGVVVHFHDIFSGFEYPAGWVVDLNHSWNEIYALHCFLQYNSAFQIEFFNHYIAKRHHEAVKKLNSPEADRFLINPGGGIWLSRTKY